MGGWKSSGVGSRHGANGIRKYTKQQTLLVTRFAPTNKDIHMLPYDLEAHDQAAGHHVQAALGSRQAGLGNSDRILRFASGPVGSRHASTAGPGAMSDQGPLRVGPVGSRHASAAGPGAMSDQWSASSSGPVGSRHATTAGPGAMSDQGPLRVGCSLAGRAPSIGVDRGEAAADSRHPSAWPISRRAVGFDERHGWTPANDVAAQGVAFFQSGGMAVGPEVPLISSPPTAASATTAVGAG